MGSQIPLSLHPKELRAIILSHGWYTLKPFYAKTSPPLVAVAFNLPNGKGQFEIHSSDNNCLINIKEGSEENCHHVAYTCLSLDVDTSFFYRELKRFPKWQWIIKNKMGRFLRSPSLFEDCCKAILTTNTTWRRTIQMVNALVEMYGEKVEKKKAFPTPERLYKEGEITLRESIGCGFRAKYILHLCKMALENTDFYLCDGWKNVKSEAFWNALETVMGLGPVSINYLGLIYAKPKGYGIDSYIKRRCSELWGIENEDINPFIVERYGDLEDFGPTVFWFELTRHWHSKERDSSNDDW